MVVHKVYGQVENIPGEWIPLGLDHQGEDGIKVKVRTLPQEALDRIGKKYGREIVITHEGTRRPFRERNEQEIKDWAHEIAGVALLDIKNYEVEIADDAAVTRWKQWLKRDDLQLGEVVNLEGKLGNNLIKSWVLKESDLWARVEREVVDDDTGAKRMVIQDQSLAIFAFYCAQDKNYVANALRKSAEGN